jgi:GTPase SAR1 family protein
MLHTASAVIGGWDTRISSNLSLGCGVCRTFDSIRNWVGQIQQHADVHVNKILIGNKCDMTPQRGEENPTRQHHEF